MRTNDPAFHETDDSLVLTPHRSATWEDDLWLVAAVALLAVPIAVGWALAGYWVILPLCGLELGALVLGLYISSHSLLAREVVTVDDDWITIEAGRRRVERRFELRRHWARVGLESGRGKAHPQRLIVRSHGRAVELGRFLTEDEREAAAARLRNLIARGATPR
jgi:uncharacterized membrane protein